MTPKQTKATLGKKKGYIDSPPLSSKKSPSHRPTGSVNIGQQSSPSQSKSKNTQISTFSFAGAGTGAGTGAGSGSGAGSTFGKKSKFHVFSMM